MVWSKCPPINVLKKRYGLKIMIKEKKIVVSWSITFACSKGGIKLIVYKSCGELYLAVQCKTCTVWPSQSCNFKKLKVYETKLNIQNIVIAFFIDMYKLDATQNGYKKYKNILL